MINFINIFLTNILFALIYYGSFPILLINVLSMKAKCNNSHSSVFVNTIPALDLVKIVLFTPQVDLDSDVEDSDVKTQQFVFSKVECYSRCNIYGISLCDLSQDWNLSCQSATWTGTKNMNSFKCV